MILLVISLQAWPGHHGNRSVGDSLVTSKRCQQTALMTCCLMSCVRAFFCSWCDCWVLSRLLFLWFVFLGRSSFYSLISSFYSLIVDNEKQLKGLLLRAEFLAIRCREKLAISSYYHHTDRNWHVWLNVLQTCTTECTADTARLKTQFQITKTENRKRKMERGSVGAWVSSERGWGNATVQTVTERSK